jgi:hypothetical protein
MKSADMNDWVLQYGDQFYLVRRIDVWLSRNICRITVLAFNEFDAKFYYIDQTDIRKPTSQTVKSAMISMIVYWLQGDNRAF